jgi:hypothetical protein
MGVETHGLAEFAFVLRFLDEAEEGERLGANHISKPSGDRTIENPNRAASAWTFWVSSGNC